MNTSHTAGRPSTPAEARQSKKPSHRTTYRRKLRIAKTLWLSDLNPETKAYALKLIGVADGNGNILSTDFRAWIEGQELGQDG